MAGEAAKFGRSESSFSAWSVRAAGLIRSNIDNKIREAERIVSETGPHDINERPEDRVAQFLRELRRTLRQRLEQEPQNKIWHEAVLLLDIPRIYMKR